MFRTIHIDAPGCPISIEVTNGFGNLGSGSVIFSTRDRGESKLICKFLQTLLDERIEGPRRELSNAGRIAWDTLLEAR